MTVSDHQAAWYKISCCMLPCKAIYFFQLAKEFSFRMNLVLFLSSIGLSKSQAGLVVGIRLLCVIVATPMFGMIADKFTIHRIVITLCSLVAMMASSAQPILAYIYGPTRFLYCENGNAKTERRTTLNRTAAINISSNLTETATENMFEGIDIDRLFWIMLAINIFQSIFDGALEGFIDVGVMVRLKQRNKKPRSSRHQYGNQRFLGVLGQVIGPIMVNYAIHKFPSRRVTCYTGLFIAYTFMQLMYLLCMLWLFHGLDFSHEVHEIDDKIVGDNEDDNEVQEMIEIKQPENNKAESAPNFKDLLRKTLLEEEMMMMFLSIFIAGIMMCVITSYSFPYLNDLHATTMDLNIYLIFLSFGNLIGFLLCHKIIHKVGGPFQALTLTFCFYVIRFIAVASTNSPLVVSIFQILSMFDLPITETVCLEFAMQKSPKILLSTLIGLMNSVQYSLSDAIGGTIGGFLYQLHDGKVVFYSFSMVAAAMSIILTAWKLIGKYCRRQITDKHDTKDIVGS